MIRYGLFWGMLLVGAAAWAERPSCPPADRPDSTRDTYLDAHLTYVGALKDPATKALDQIELAKCVVSWCTRPLQPRHKIRASDALLRAGKHPLTQSKVPALQARLNACAEPVNPPPGGGWRPIAGWSLVGAGVVATALGFVFQSAADDASADYDAAIAAMSSSTIINGHANDAASNGDLAEVGWIAGGVLAAAGLGILIWDWTDDAPVRAWVTPQGVGLGGRF
jgi:hypothetical protein